MVLRLGVGLEGRVEGGVEGWRIFHASHTQMPNKSKPNNHAWPTCSETGWFAPET